MSGIKNQLLLNPVNSAVQPSRTSENRILSKVLAEKEKILKLFKNGVKSLHIWGLRIFQKSDNTIVGWNANQLPQTNI